MDTDTSTSQMRRGVLELCILSIIDRGAAYPAEIGRALQESELLVVEGTLYPLLTRLRRAGLLTHEWVETQAGPPRKYYMITESGQETLATLRVLWDSMSQSVTALLNHS